MTKTLEIVVFLRHPVQTTNFTTQNQAILLRGVILCIVYLYGYIFPLIIISTKFAYQVKKESTFNFPNPKCTP